MKAIKTKLARLWFRLRWWFLLTQWTHTGWLPGLDDAVAFALRYLRAAPSSRVDLFYAMTQREGELFHVIGSVSIFERAVRSLDDREFAALRAERSMRDYTERAQVVRHIASSFRSIASTQGLRFK